MSTNYYLHSTDFPESAHIGATAGEAWTTDASLFAQGDARGWRDTAGLLACLEAHGNRAFRFTPWVADEYGRTWSPREAAALIRAHEAHHELDVAFT